VQQSYPSSHWGHDVSTQAAHTPPWQIREPQSRFVTHALSAAQRVQAPPQSTSVSVPFLTLSEHVSAQTPVAHVPL
jgi:hypothetical protein